ncbi:MAG TPA: fluoride efflux transporter CrcB [Bryobacteraceae bacterium]|jgi:fluoride exporter|nr:fluoride efflux transporter CrcB [Bryobacteraceae bacterium]
MQSILLVALGSAVGGVCRLLLSRGLLHAFGDVFPWAIFLVNVSGSLLIGYFTGSRLPSPQQLLLTTGFCGGFTTFSTFSFELLDLMRRGETGKAGLYAVASVVVCVAATWLGWRWGSSAAQH